jgi:hypothetical protein
MSEARLRRTAEHALRGLAAITKGQGGNYEVVAGNVGDGAWHAVVEGSRDYCVGYAEASNTGPTIRIFRVACNGFVVWPESHWGQSLDPDDPCQGAWAEDAAHIDPTDIPDPGTRPAVEGDND